MKHNNQADPDKKFILIAEDDMISYNYFEAILSSLKTGLLHARDGEEAVNMCKENSAIVLVLMDLKMPRMDGWEATRRIREFNKDLPIIAQSAYAFINDREDAIAAGCNDYITKPIHAEEILQIISNFIGN